MSERAIRLVVTGMAATVLGCAVPAVAGATDYCVDRAGCAVGNDYASLEAALAKADDDPDADRVLLGAKTYPAPTVSGFSYQAQSAPVEIIGLGVGQTILTGPTGAESILDLSGGAGSSVSDLTVHGPANVSFGFTGVMTNNTARRIEVTEDSTQTNNFRMGLYLGDGGTLEDSKVTLDPAHTGTATAVFLEGGHVRRSVLRARTGATTNDGSIEQSRIFGGDLGLRAYGGTTMVTATRFDIAEGDGIHAEAYAGVAHTLLNASGVTIVSMSPGTAGAVASTEFDPGFGAEVSLTNAVLRGFSRSLEARAPGAAQAKVTASYSDYDPSGNGTTGSPNASISEANVSNLGAGGFVDAAGGDYRLLPGSPLVDAGDPATAPGFDLDGNPLVADGNADGTARRDIGAFELPAAPVAARPGGTSPDTTAPLISRFRATPSLFATARARTPLAARVPRGTHLRYALSEPAKVILKVQRRLAGRRARHRTVGRLWRTGKSGANSIRFSGRLGRRALRPGRYRVRITAIDTAGNRSAMRTTRLRIARR